MSFLTLPAPAELIPRGASWARPLSGRNRICGQRLLPFSSDARVNSDCFNAKMAVVKPGTQNIYPTVPRRRHAAHEAKVSATPSNALRRD